MNKLLFTGTGAADFSPLLGTAYKNTLSKDIRRSSCMLIDGKTLIDCGPHTLESLRLLGVPLSGIRNLLITHFHADHFSSENVKKLASEAGGGLNIFFSAEADTSCLPENARLYPLTPFERVCPDKLGITALPANHTRFPIHYLLDEDDISLFYGCDGAWLLRDTFYFLRDKRLDAAVFECTVGDEVGNYRASEHNSIPMLRLLLPSLRTVNALRPDTLVLASHFARTLHTCHDELEALLVKDGIKAAYDGMEISIKSE